MDTLERLGQNIIGDNEDRSGISKVSGDGMNIITANFQHRNSLHNPGRINPAEICVFKYDGFRWNLKGEPIRGLPNNGEITEDSNQGFIEIIDVAISENGNRIAVSYDGYSIVIKETRSICTRKNKKRYYGRNLPIQKPSIYVFDYDEGNNKWVEFGKIEGKNAESVELSGDGTILATGVYSEDENDDVNGKCEIYKLDGDNWNLLSSDIPYFFRIYIKKYNPGSDERQEFQYKKTSMSKDGKYFAVLIDEKVKAFKYSYLENFEDGIYVYKMNDTNDGYTLLDTVSIENKKINKFELSGDGKRMVVSVNGNETDDFVTKIKTFELNVENKYSGFTEDIRFTDEIYRYLNVTMNFSGNIVGYGTAIDIRGRGSISGNAESGIIIITDQFANYQFIDTVNRNAVTISLSDDGQTLVVGDTFYEYQDESGLITAYSLNSIF